MGFMNGSENSNNGWSSKKFDVDGLLYALLGRFCMELGVALC